MSAGLCWWDIFLVGCAVGSGYTREFARIKNDSVTQVSRAKEKKLLYRYVNNEGKIEENFFHRLAKIFETWRVFHAIFVKDFSDNGEGNRFPVGFRVRRFVISRGGQAEDEKKTSQQHQQPDGWLSRKFSVELFFPCPFTVRSSVPWSWPFGGRIFLLFEENAADFCNLCLLYLSSMRSDFRCYGEGGKNVSLRREVLF